MINNDSVQAQQGRFVAYGGYDQKMPGLYL